MSKKKTGMANMFTEFNIWTPGGEQVLHRVSKMPKGKLGRGWVAIYKKAVRKLIIECPSYNTLRIYLFLASKQTYEKVVIVAAKTVIEALNINISSFTRGIKWLIEHEYIKPMVVDGVRGWILNPQVTVCGASSKNGKQRLWTLQKNKERAQLEEDIEQRKKLIETLDQLIMENLTEEEDNDDEDIPDNFTVRNVAGNSLEPGFVQSEGYQTRDTDGEDVSLFSGSDERESDTTVEREPE